MALKLDFFKYFHKLAWFMAPALPTSTAAAWVTLGMPVARHLCLFCAVKNSTHFGRERQRNDMTHKSHRRSVNYARFMIFWVHSRRLNNSPICIFFWKFPTFHRRITNVTELWRLHLSVHDQLLKTETQRCREIDTYRSNTSLPALSLTNITTNFKWDKIR